MSSYSVLYPWHYYSLQAKAYLTGKINRQKSKSIEDRSASFGACCLPSYCIFSMPRYAELVMNCIKSAAIVLMKSDANC